MKNFMLIAGGLDGSVTISMHEKYYDAFQSGRSFLRVSGGVFYLYSKQLSMMKPALMYKDARAGLTGLNPLLALLRSPYLSLIMGLSESVDTTNWDMASDYYQLLGEALHRAMALRPVTEDGSTQAHHT